MKRAALYALIGAVWVFIGVKLLFNSGDATAVVPAAQLPVGMAEKRLDEMRKAAATVPAKEDRFKNAAAQLAAREQGLIKAGNVQQAEVALLDTVQNAGRANGIDIRGSQEFRDRPLDDYYGEVAVTVAFSCGMEQLVNLLATIANQPQILATSEIHVSGGSDKKKNVQVRLTVAAAVPRKLIPQKKGVSSF